jgi:hypothetical protein
MPMTIRAAMSMLVIAAGAIVAARAEEKSTSIAAKQFVALKGLAGDWVEVGKDGKPTDKVVSSIRVTAGGTAVQETLMPGTDHEMVTLYNIDGADLILTHYCMLGNQPRMRAEAGGDASTIAFKFVAAGNLKSTDEQHMHEATLTIAGKDRFQAVWVGNKDGKACHEVKFDLVRKPK